MEILIQIIAYGNHKLQVHVVCKLLQHFILKSKGLSPVNKIANGIVFCNHFKDPFLTYHIQVNNPHRFQVLHILESRFLPPVAGNQSQRNGEHQEQASGFVK
jgi:hypothetical protein